LGFCCAPAGPAANASTAATANNTVNAFRADFIFFLLSLFSPHSNPCGSTRVLKNKNQAVSQGLLRCASVKLLVLVVLGGGQADPDDETLFIELIHHHTFGYRDGSGKRPALGL
jgi:hypothetical protein